MTIEEQIRKIVDQRIDELIPDITQKLREELVFKQINQIMFTKKDLAKRLGKSTSTVSNYMKNGMPYHYTPTGALEFDIREVEKWLKI